MGIPHLAHHLQPHGTKLVLSRATPGTGDQIPAIIDGPSLAYQCLYVCLSRNSSARNAIEAAPSYKELGEAAISWLEQIEQFGLKVEAVFFDGLLPLTKKPTRLSRLQNYANQLVSFRALHKEDFPPRLSSFGNSKAELLSAVTLSARFKALPAPPFLVPAVIEALLSSRYKEVTSVIPGEADAYCAQSARQLGGTIFTSDSDLLVHDLGEAGKVILFRDIESIHLPSKGKCLKAIQYQPSAIAEKFGLPNLVKPAFFMTEDNHCNLTEAVKRAKERNTTSSEFADFKEQYASLPVLSTLAKEYLTHSDRPVFKLLSQLDPRISELVHQISMRKRAALRIEDQALDMYLPFLIDDSTRTSAWRAGAHVRTLAYSMLRLLDPEILRIDEYERKGTRIADTPSTLIHPNELPASVDNFAESLSALLAAERSVGLSKVGKWRLIAAGLVCRSNIENGKAPPLTSDLTRLITSSREGPISWSFMHTFAQMQAVLYSLRLLVQTAQIALAFLEEMQKRPETFREVHELMAVLKDLPSLSELLDDSAQPDGGAMEAAKAAISEQLKSLGIEQPSESSKAAKRKKKRKQKEEHATETTPPAWRQNNMFGSLMNDS